MLSAGDLPHRLTILHKVVTRGAALGEEVVTWPELGKAWCSVADQVTTTKGGDEDVKANLRQLARRSIVKMRYRSDLKTSMRLYWPARDRTFEITGISELGQRDGLEVTVEEYKL